MTETLIAFDPGATTGVAVLDTNVENSLTLMQINGYETTWQVLHIANPNLIIYEKFLYQRRDKVDLTPVEHIGIIKLYAERTKTPIIGQTAAQAKAFWSDSKLKKLDLWEKGQPHAMDALRHLLYYRLFTLKDQSIIEGLHD